MILVLTIVFHPFQLLLELALGRRASFGCLQLAHDLVVAAPALQHARHELKGLHGGLHLVLR